MVCLKHPCDHHFYPNQIHEDIKVINFFFTISAPQTQATWWKGTQFFRRVVKIGLDMFSVFLKEPMQLGYTKILLEGRVQWCRSSVIIVSFIVHTFFRCFIAPFENVDAGWVLSSNKVNSRRKKLNIVLLNIFKHERLNEFQFPCKLPNYCSVFSDVLVLNEFVDHSRIWILLLLWGMTNFGIFAMVYEGSGLLILVSLIFTEWIR